MKKSLCVLLWLAVVASGGPAIAHNCHREPQYSLADGNHTHEGGCKVVPILRPRPDSKEGDRAAPGALKERPVNPPDKGPIR